MSPDARLSHLPEAEQQRIAAVRAARQAKKAAEASGDALLETLGTSLTSLAYEFSFGEVRIEEDWHGEGDGIAGLQWAGGLTLSRFFDAADARFPPGCWAGKRVCEVGAGCGLTSIVLARLGAAVTVTDADVSKCAGNLELNLSGDAAARCRRQRLYWGDAAEAAACGPPFDVVVAGDCCYDVPCVEPLLRTVAELLGDGGGVCYLAGTVGLEPYYELKRLVGRYFDVRSVGVTACAAGGEDRAGAEADEDVGGADGEDSLFGRRPLLELRVK